MKSFRFLLSVAVLAALGAGYFGSQSFALNRRAPDWAKIVDTPIVVWLSLAALVTAVALALIPDREERT